MSTTRSLAHLLERIHAEFPDLSWSTHRYLNNGWDHEVIILDEKLVFRFPNSPEYLKLLEDEVALLGFLDTKVNIKIPQYEFVAADHSFAGYPLIRGSELTESIFAGMSEQDRASIASQFAGFFTALHTIDVPVLEKYHVSRETPFEYEIKNLSEKYLKPQLTAEEYQKVERVIAEFEQINIDELPKALIHNDLSPKHILWDAENQSVGIIDFSDRCIADPALDFAGLYSYNSVFVEQVYALYEGFKDPEFLNRAKTYQRQVGVFMLADSFRTQKISFEEAKRTFDRAVTL